MNTQKKHLTAREEDELFKEELEQYRNRRIEFNQEVEIWVAMRYGSKVEPPQYEPLRKEMLRRYTRYKNNL